MIFITTGTQEPFDRLLKLIYDFSLKNHEEIIIQAKTQLKFPDHVIVKEFLTPVEFEEYFQRADLIISHAGMGTIISALTLDKILLILPRIASLGEHRNEHQLATAKKMKELDLIHVAFDDMELKNFLNDLPILFKNKKSSVFGKTASKALINSIDNFIQL